MFDALLAMLMAGTAGSSGGNGDVWHWTPGGK